MIASTAPTGEWSSLHAYSQLSDTGDARICRESRVHGSAEGKVTPAGLASWKVMSTPRSRRFPVTVTHLPVTRCRICDRTLAYRPGNISEVLTEHYRRTHPEALGIPSQ